MWVFGYGSLIWKVDFPYERRVPGFIRGHVRRFWQHGHEADQVTWGVAYKVADADVERVRAHLDYREKAMVYIGTTSNSEFVGPEPIELIAERIATSIGPSGPNRDYLLNLCRSLRSLAPDAHDDHLFDLERRVLAWAADKVDASVLNQQ
ncbi:ChaC-like protein-domain-containing protein [Thamnocephalis sphaerospora]|uniref:glutathione-specific gamma-glutamylcyclotransferase n=1 Tax=Thamnocephalis sphaerospora TaxID=78915 RepID=A0A4P9XUH0_9FUNG|nr:ChaC-like protein-domain-containing protein [Thamnocephalis sphaerospora]|eukprot:RKP09602.1 ChaC-like protein-domain-containing protein [Thamnocephalis sphaerospora]